MSTVPPTHTIVGPSQRRAYDAHKTYLPATRESAKVPTSEERPLLVWPEQTKKEAEERKTPAEAAQAQVKGGITGVEQRLDVLTSEVQELRRNLDLYASRTANTMNTALNLLQAHEAKLSTSGSRADAVVLTRHATSPPPPRVKTGPLEIKEDAASSATVISNASAVASSTGAVTSSTSVLTYSNSEAALDRIAASKPNDSFTIRQIAYLRRRERAQPGQPIPEGFARNLGLLTDTNAATSSGSSSTTGTEKSNSQPPIAAPIAWGLHWPSIGGFMAWWQQGGKTAATNNATSSASSSSMTEVEGSYGLGP